MSWLTLVGSAIFLIFLQTFFNHYYLRHREEIAHEQKVIQDEIERVEQKLKVLNNNYAKHEDDHSGVKHTGTSYYDPEGVAAIVFVDAPLWVQRRYSPLVSTALTVIPKTWKVQIFYRDSKAIKGFTPYMRERFESSGRVVFTPIKGTAQPDLPEHCIDHKNNQGQGHKNSAPNVRTMKKKDLILSYWFWDSLLAEKVLLFGPNVAFCGGSTGTGLDDFLQHDYISSSFLSRQQLPSSGGGDGRDLALYSRSLVMEAFFPNHHNRHSQHHNHEKSDASTPLLYFDNRNETVGIETERKRYANSTFTATAAMAAAATAWADRAIQSCARPVSFANGRIFEQALLTTLQQRKQPSSLSSMASTTSHNNRNNHKLPPTIENIGKFTLTQPFSVEYEHSHGHSHTHSHSSRGSGSSGVGGGPSIDGIDDLRMPIGLVGTLDRMPNTERATITEVCPEIKFSFPALHNPSCFGAKPNGTTCCATLCAMDPSPGGC